MDKNKAKKKQLNLRYSKAFGKVLRKMREDTDQSQEQFAYEANLDRTFISMLERAQDSRP